MFYKLLQELPEWRNILLFQDQSDDFQLRLFSLKLNMQKNIKI